MNELKFKFLDTEFHQEINSDVTRIRNRVIGLATLKECSSGKTLKKIIDDKLFTSEDLKNSMKGFAHDNGSQLVGSNIGVTSLLKNDGNEFYDFDDPCHELNLTIKESVQILPKELINFVRSITN